MTKLRIWIGLAIIEAFVIATLIGSKTKILVQQTETPIIPVRSPLQLALEYDASDRRFEELVTNHPGWISYIPRNPGGNNWPILAECALSKKTNYVRVLIENGADIEEAIKHLNEVGAEDAIQLLRQAQSKASRTIDDK
jgi:hypothetical protein